MLVVRPIKLIKMKIKLFHYFLMLLCVVFTAATILPANVVNIQPPSIVLSKLQSLYPNGQNIQWEMEKENYEAELLVNGKEVEVLFTPDGTIIGHDKEITESNLPAAVLKAFRKDHSAFMITQAYSLWTIESSQYKLIVISKKAKEHLWYDESGNLVSKKIFPPVKGKAINRNETVGFSSYNKKWELPAVLREISGIVLIDENKMACVQDELGTIYVYDLAISTITDSIHFAGPGDYEGIALVDRDIYILRSDGMIFQVSNFLTNATTKEFKLNLPQSFQNFEGLCYDKLNDRLLIAPRIFDTNDHMKKNVYAFNLKSKSFEKEPVLSFRLSDKLFENINTRKEAFIPSEISIHPNDGKILITDARNKYLLIADNKGNPTNLILLHPTTFAKTEGIAIATDGSIYLSNEGKNGPANIVRIAPDKIK